MKRLSLRKNTAVWAHPSCPYCGKRMNVSWSPTSQFFKKKKCILFGCPAASQIFIVSHGIFHCSAWTVALWLWAPEHAGFSSCSVHSSGLVPFPSPNRRMWDLVSQTRRLKPETSALQGRFSTGPPGSPIYLDSWLRKRQHGKGTISLHLVIMNNRKNH